MFFELFVSSFYLFALSFMERVDAQQLVILAIQAITCKWVGMLVTDMFLLLITEIT